METINQFYNRTNDNKQSISCVVTSYMKDKNISYEPTTFDTLFNELKKVYSRQLVTNPTYSSEDFYRNFQLRVRNTRKEY